MPRFSVTIRAFGHTSTRNIDAEDTPEAIRKAEKQVGLSIEVRSNESPASDNHIRTTQYYGDGNAV